MVQRYGPGLKELDGFRHIEMLKKIDGSYVEFLDYQELEAENARLRQQLNSANSQIQILNRVIAGDIE
jgi:hypothetical protein